MPYAIWYIAYGNGIGSLGLRTLENLATTKVDETSRSTTELLRLKCMAQAGFAPATSHL